MSAFSLGNGTTQTFSYNDRLQMDEQTLKRNSEILQKYDYAYGQLDANGNLIANSNNGQLAKIESHIGTAKQWTQKFHYDAIGRLEKAEERRGDTNALSYAQKFDYDNFGNLYRKSANNPTGQETQLPTAWIEDADIDKNTNRFKSSTGTTYDDAGNVTQDTQFRNQNLYYDANGRVYKTAHTNNINQSNAVYDAGGNRVATQVDGIWTFMIYDAFGKMICEYGGLEATDEGGVKYILKDWQGSSRAIVGNNGYVKARMDYTAFGEEIQSGVGLRTIAQGFGESNTLDNKYALTERDKATGLDHTWFRKLENQAGRWTSPDPYNGSMSLGNPQSFNRYSYVENQPTNFIDPSGLLLVIICQWYTKVYDGGPNDGEEVPGAKRWLVCKTYDDGRYGGGERKVDFPAGGVISNKSNDPDGAKRDRFKRCFLDAIDSIITEYNIIVDAIREKTDIAIRNASAAFVFAVVGIILGGFLIPGAGAITMGVTGRSPESNANTTNIAGISAITAYLIAINTAYNDEEIDIRKERDLADQKILKAFKDCKDVANL